MKPQRFVFIFSKAIRKTSGRLHNLQIEARCTAYFYHAGELRTINIESVHYKGEKVPTNFLWAINEELQQEINDAAFEHAKEKFLVIDTILTV